MSSTLKVAEDCETRPIPRWREYHFASLLGLVALKKTPPTPIAFATVEPPSHPHVRPTSVGSPSLSCGGRGCLGVADPVSFNDEMDSSCDSVGINVPESLLVKA
jgi:hypothetical protein